MKIHKFSDSMHYLPVPKEEAERWIANGHRRVVCHLNESETLHVALISSKEVGYYIYLSAKILKKLNLQEGDEVAARFEADTSEHQFQVPEEWAEVLRTDPEAEEKFNSLTPGNRRSIMALITQVKSAQKQVERSLLIAERLKMGITSVRELAKMGFRNQ